MPYRPRLTQDESLRVAELYKAGETVQNIAASLGFTCRQVWRALTRLGLMAATAIRKRTSRVPIAVISADQQQLIVRWQQSGLTVVALAQRLRVDWRPLSYELRAIKQMNPTRLARLEKLLTQKGL